MFDWFNTPNLNLNFLSDVGVGINFSIPITKQICAKVKSDPESFLDFVTYITNPQHTDYMINMPLQSTKYESIKKIKNSFFYYYYYPAIGVKVYKNKKLI